MNLSFSQTAIRTRYEFVGWFTEDDERITGETTVKIEEDTTVYAHWSPNVVVIDFDANGGSDEMATQTITYGVGSMNLTANAFVKKGYKFDGWSSGTDSFTDGQSMKDYLENNAGQSTLSLKAQWVEGPTPLSPELEPYEKEIEKGMDLVLVIRNTEKIDELHIYKNGKKIPLKKGDYKVEVKNGETSAVEITVYSKVMIEAGEYRFEVKIGGDVISGDFVVSPVKDHSGNDKNLPTIGIILSGMTVLILIMFASVILGSKK